MVIYDHTLPTVSIMAAVAGATAACLCGYWLYVKRDVPMAIMAALRVLFMAALAWCLLLPGQKLTHTLQQKARFAVVLDRSLSMTLAPPEEGVTSRWAVAQSALHQNWPQALSENCDMDYYAFASDVSAKMSLEEAETLTPDGSATLLRDAVKKVMNQYEGLDLKGCVLLTDGLDTREAFADWALEKRTIPIYTLSLEKEGLWEAEPDVRVDTVNTARRVTVGWQTELKAIVSGQGTKGQAMKVQLFKDEVLAQEQETQIPAGGGSREVVFSLDHAVIGINTYRVWIPPLSGETQTNDNEYSVSVQVVDAKNRLLYVEGPPRWESKYLTRVLRASKQVTPVIYLSGADGKFLTFGVREDVAPDMKESQLAFFKMLIVGNLSGEELGEERARNIVKFVEQGGSLVLLGGSKAWSPEGFAKTSLKKILPAKQYGGTPVEGEFPVQLTDMGRTHPAFAGDPTLWMGIPPLLSVYPKVVPTPGARVLVVARTGTGDQPVMLTQNFGQGKVVAIFTDSLWKWQLSPDASKNKQYPRFWDQLISWLTPKEEKSEGKDLEIFVDREQCYKGEEIEVTARWTGATPPPAGTEVITELGTPDKRRIPFAMTRQEDPMSGGKTGLVCRFRYKGEQAGLFSVTAVADVGGKRTESDPVSFSVKPFTPESVPRSPDTHVLRALADNSGGQYFETVKAMNQALSALKITMAEQEISEYRSLWQHWLAISALIALLSAEWIVRKLRNLP